MKSLSVLLRPFVFLAIFGSACALTFEVQEKRPVEVSRTEIYQAAPQYSFNSRADKEMLFVSLGSNQNQKIQTVDRVLSVSRKSMTNESGEYIGRAWVPVGNGWGSITKDKSPLMFPVLNLILLIPSLGISGVVMIVDLITLPIRMLLPDSKSERTENSERLIDFPLTGMSTTCEGKKVWGDGSIPLSDVLTKGKISILCKVYWNGKEIGMHRIPLAQLAVKSPQAAQILAEQRKLLLIRLKEYVSPEMEKDFPNRNLALDNAIIDIALGLYPRDNAAIRITHAAGLLNSKFEIEYLLARNRLRRELYSLEVGH